MAHFAELNENNIVTQVIVIDNNDILDEQNNESEVVGIQLCTDLFGGTWVQTSYNARIRKNYASIGSTFDTDADAFIPSKPSAMDSWVLNNTSYTWEPPLPRPEGDHYAWDEYTLSWIQQADQPISVD